MLIAFLTKNSGSSQKVTIETKKLETSIESLNYKVAVSSPQCTFWKESNRIVTGLEPRAPELFPKSQVVVSVIYGRT